MSEIIAIFSISASQWIVTAKDGHLLYLELYEILQPQTLPIFSRQFNEINCISHFNNIVSENVLCLFYISACSFMLRFPLIHSFSFIPF